MTTGSWWRTALLGAVAVAFLGSATATRASEPRIITISAKRFEFSPGEVRLKKGETVTIRIASADVTHGLYMKALGIDAEIEPGKTTEVTFTPKAAGRFTAICDHFCGPGHANMHMDFVVE
ncbi:MAG TPA: cupredoxin domain-containing protein [Anaeromyxobacteraceae bacterium]|nr:cupredoxin domain-containing protein [Anaeromyxobacteraceae bacterium]